MTLLRQLATGCLHLIDPETAHDLAIRALESGWVGGCGTVDDPALRVRAAGLDFPNPLGMAAGFDKNARVPDALLGLGFGFVEVGTVTPHPQPGNPKPRLFRLKGHKAIINRFGFNNDGHAAIRERLEKRRANGGIVGVNIGANKDSQDYAADYAQGAAFFSDIASYLTVNISSPNTPGLRNLQTTEALKVLLDGVFDALDRKLRHPPVFLKVAPDLDDDAIDAIASVAGKAPLAGLMISNTTLDRKAVQGDRAAGEAGGLSGLPLFHRSTVVLARFAQRLPERMVLVGIGGVHDTATALAKIEAGASLVQLYSGMIYEGPCLAQRILDGLAETIAKRGVANLQALRGSKRDEWSGRQMEAA